MSQFGFVTSPESLSLHSLVSPSRVVPSLAPSATPQPMLLLPISLLLSLSSLINAIPAPAPQATTPVSASTTAPATTSVPFFSIPLTATPTATGNSQINGSVVTITNSAGAGTYTDTFIYTAASLTVAPTGNITVSQSGAAASASNLQPDPKNLQTAAASKVHREGMKGTGLILVGTVFVGFLGGVGLVL